MATTSTLGTVMFSLGLALAAGCTPTTGTVSGDLETPGTKQSEAITMVWHSDGSAGVRGTIETTLPGGETFSGPYLQVTQETQGTETGGMWVGWDEGWGDWGPGWGEMGPEETFATVYSGRVIANLKGSGGDRMRCRFLLADPATGMAGGGQGECQLTNGQVISAVLDIPK